MPLTRIDSAFLDLDAIGGIDFDVQSGVPTFSVDAVNHKVGIGTDSPTTKLEVIGDITVSKQNAFIELKDPDTADANYRLRNQGGSFSIYDVTNNQVKIAATAGGVTIYPNLNANNGLDVMGTITGDGNLDIADGIRHYGDTNTSISFPAADTITAETDGTERLRIDSEGRIGIGTDNLQARLTVYSAASSTYKREIRIDASDATGGSGVGLFKIVGDGNSLGKYIIAYNSTHPSQANDVSLKNSDGDISFYTAANATPAEKVRITTTGRVGINEPSPAYTLDLGESPSTIRLVSENNGTAIRVGAGGGSNDVTLIRVDGDTNNHDGESDSAQYGFSLKYLGSGSQNDNAFAIFSDNQAGTQVQAFTVLQDGNVGINGKVNVGGSAGAVGSKFNIFNGSDADNILGITGADESSEYAAIGVSGGNAIITGGGAGTTSTGVVFRTAASGTEAERLRISSGGDVQVNGGAIHIDANGELAVFETDTNLAFTNSAKLAFDYSGNIARIRSSHNGSGTTRDIAIYTGNNDRLHITSAGNVGIGIIDPECKLQVGGDLQVGDSNTPGTFINVVGAGVSQNFGIKFGGGTANPESKFSILGNTNHSDIMIRFSGGTERVRITSAGRIGIGTNNPSTMAHMYGSSGLYTRFEQVDGKKVNFGISNGDGIIDVTGANPLRVLVNNGSERLRITSDGNVGINSGSPSEKLDVGGTTKTQQLNVTGETNLVFTKIKLTNNGQALQIINTSTANNAYVDQRFNIDGHSRAGLRGQIHGANLGGQLRFYTAANTQVLTERAVIDQEGRFGIGTGSPAEILDVQTPSGGRIQFDKAGIDGSRILFAEADGTVRATINNFGGSNETLQLNAPSKIDLAINGAEKVRLDANGRLLIGTLSSSGSHTLEVNSGTDNEGIKVVSTDAGSYIRFADNSTTAQIRLGAVGDDFKIDVNASERLRIGSSGQIGLGGANYGTSGQVLTSNGANSAPTWQNSTGGGSSSGTNAAFRKYTYSISSTTNSITGSSDAVVSAGSFIAGYKYTIKTVGTTDFTTIGASANTVGVVFTATGVGSGNGDAFDTLFYSIGGDQNVEVYVNGVKAVEGSTNDYVATSGTSVNLTANVVSGDVVDIQVYELLTDATFVPASGGTFTGNVGIGTATPSQKLSVHGTQTVASFGNLANVDQLDIQVVAGYPTIQCPSSADTLQLASMGSVKIAIDSNNNSSESFEIVHGGRDAGGNRLMYLDEGGNFEVSQAVAAWTSSTNHPILMWDYKQGPGDMMYMASGGNTPAADQMALVVSDGHGFKVGKSGYNGTDADISSSNEFLRIKTDGNVGIGINNPARKLEVGGDIYYHNSAIIASDGGTSNIDHIWHNDNGFAGTTGGSWNFCSDTTYKATGNSGIRMGGKLGVGATPGGNPGNLNAFIAIGDSDTGIGQDGDGELELWANNQEILHLNTGVVNLLKDFRCGGGTGLPGYNNTTQGIYMERGNGAIFAYRTSSFSLHLGRSNNGEVLRIKKNNSTQAGRLSITGNSTIALQNGSDYRLKTNIEEIPNVVSSFRQLKPCQFEYISEPGEVFQGFIAHELQEVNPKFASGVKDEVDENGDIVEQGVDTRDLVPLLTAALQEAFNMIDNLQEQINQLSNP